MASSLTQSRRNYLTQESEPDASRQNDPHRQCLATSELWPERRITDIREFLAFKHGDEEYGMANTPAFIKGVINFRGVIVPILEMRIKFNLAQLRPVPEFSSTIGRPPA